MNVQAGRSLHLAQPTATDFTGSNVLTTFCNRNHAVRPPLLDRLRQSGIQGPSTGNEGKQGSAESDEGSNKESGTPLAGRAPRHSKTAYGTVPSKPFHLRFYADLPGWVVVLESAKNKFRLHISTVNPFPVVEHHSATATACIAEAMADFHKNSNATLDEGMDHLKLTHCHCDQCYSPAVYHKYNRQMLALVRSIALAHPEH